MRFKKFTGIILTLLFMFSSVNVCSADYYVYGNYDDFWDYIFNNSYEDDSEYLTPVITSPSKYDTILYSDEIIIKWKYTGEYPCSVSVQDEDGNISQLEVQDNTARIAPYKCSRGYSYIVTVKAGDAVSEPFTITIADRKAEIVEIISRTSIEPAEERIEREAVIPEGAFDSKETADKFVKTINVNVWRLNQNNQKVTATIPITVNAKLADSVSSIFAEIYNNDIRFPIKSASCYCYRTTASGARLSEHAYGTAIDINPDENYCVYSNGTTVGSCYEPYINYYSVTPEIINIFRKHNFSWGGSFGDYMHFSYFGT